jgi:two-component system response regulator NreC
MGVSPGGALSVIRILLVDDHTMVRAGLRLVLEEQPDLCVAAEAASGEEAIRLALRLQPRVVILDCTLPDMGGLEVLQRLRARMPDVRVLMLAGTRNERDLLHALHMGALGFLLKEESAATLIHGVRAVAHGQLAVRWPVHGVFIAPLAQAASRRLAPPRHSMLTQREQEVVRLVARGLSNAEIARRLGISAKTVDTHRTHAMDKLDLHCRADLTHYALEQGFLTVA